MNVLSPIFRLLGPTTVSILLLLLIVITTTMSASAAAASSDEAQKKSFSSTGGGTFSILVAGATGAIGRRIVSAAVASPAYVRVVALSRRALKPEDYAATFPGIDVSLASKKLQVVAVDWEALWQAQEAEKKRVGGGGTDAGANNSPLVQQACAVPPSVLSQPVGGGASNKMILSDPNAFVGHTHAAMSMATTRKDAGSGEAFKHVDLDYAVAFMRQLKAQSADTLQHYSQISSQGASASSWLLYMEVKGKTDNEAVAAKFRRTSIFRPGLLGREDKARGVESCASWFVTPMPAETLGQAVINDHIAQAGLAAISSSGAGAGAGGSSVIPNNAGVSYFSNADIYSLVVKEDQKK